MAFNIQGAHECMKGARALVGHFNSSSQATTDLLDIQTNRVTPLHIIQDVATRWWSTYSMVNRLLDLKDSFEELVARDIMDEDINLTVDQWDALVDIKSLLEPFMIVQKVLEGQKYPTSSLVPYLIKKVRDGIRKVANQNRLPTIRELATRMLNDPVNGFNTYWGSGEPGSVFEEHLTLGARNRKKGCPFPTLIAAALDPRMKQLPFLDYSDKEKVWAAVLVLMQQIQVEKMGDKIPEALIVQQNAPQPLPVQKNNSLLLGLFDDLYDPVNEEAAEALIPEEEVAPDPAVLLALLNEELRRYQTRKGQLMIDGPQGPKHETAGYTNPLQWWKRNAADLPHLSELAKRYLCIPATSAPSERVFSAAGLTIAKTRASLHPDNAADLIFLHNSWDYADKFNARRKEEEALMERLHQNRPIVIV